MKISELEEILMFTDVGDIEADLTRAVVMDEFHHHSAIHKDYRNRAIDRLVALKKNWYTENNISWEVARRFIQVKCPYCGEMMEWHGVTGRMYVCGCGAVANIPHEDITFTPPKPAA